MGITILKQPKSPRVCMQTRVRELRLPRSRHRWQVPKQSPGFPALLSLAAHSRVFPHVQPRASRTCEYPSDTTLWHACLYKPQTCSYFFACWGERLPTALVPSVSQRFDSQKVHSGIPQSFRLVGDCWELCLVVKTFVVSPWLPLPPP